MLTLNENATIKKVTSLLENKNRFAFTTYTRSALLSAVGDLKGDKKPSKYFTRSILAGLASTDSAFIKAAPSDSLYSLEDKLNKIGLKNENFYDSSFLEHYINNNHEVFDIFMAYYLKYSKAVVISFQYKSLISKYFPKDSFYIHVPYNDFYDKIDSVTSQVCELEKDYSLCVLDCPMFSSAVAPKIWEKTNMSILDLGKSLTVARAVARAKA